MQKRLMFGLVAATLATAMLPGAASAKWPGERQDSGPFFWAEASCVTNDGPVIELILDHVAPAGVQSILFEELRTQAAAFGGCVPGKKTHAFAKFAF